MPNIIYKQDTEGVDWQEMKDILIEDKFDNGRTPQQYRISFEKSAAVVIAYADNKIIGTARGLSDGVCNAYVVDVWTYTPYRHQGIATEMMQLLMGNFIGQHVYLFTDDAMDLYEKVGFQRQGIGMGAVVGEWLQNETRK